MIVRPRPPATLDRAPPGAWSAPGAGDADLVFDLTGSAEPEPGAIVPLYDGAAGDAARDAALLDGHAPWIELAQLIGDAPRVYASALPALRRRDQLSCGRAAIADALVALVAQLAARGLGEAVPAARRRGGAVAGPRSLRRGDARRADRAAAAPPRRQRRPLARRRPGARAERRRRLPASTGSTTAVGAGSPTIAAAISPILSCSKRAASPMSSARNISTRLERASFRSSRSTTRALPARRASCWNGPATSPIPSSSPRRRDLDDAREREKSNARTLPRRSVSAALDARPRAVERRRDRRRDAVRLERRLVARRDRRRNAWRKLGLFVFLSGCQARSDHGPRRSTDRL